MEHRERETGGQIRLRCIGKVAWNEYVRWICNPRMIMFFCMLLFIETYVVDKMLQYSDNLGAPLGIFEVFTAVANSVQLCVMIAAVFLLLMGDFPRKDGNTLLYVHRAGKYNWFLGQVLMMVLSAATYLAAIVLFCIATCAGHISVSNRWSDVVTKYTSVFPDEKDFIVATLINGRLYNNFTPVQAFGYSVTLLFGMLLLLLMVKVVFFMFGNPSLGVVTGGLLIGSGWTLNMVDTKLKWAFPMAHVLEWQHCDLVFRTMEVSMGQSYWYFAILCMALFIIGLFKLDKYNFGYTQGL